MTRNRCPECQGPVVDALVDEFSQRLSWALEDLRTWSHAQTFGRLGLELRRKGTTAAQAKAAFELGREVEREAHRKLEAAETPSRRRRRRTGTRPNHLHVV